MSQPAFAVVCDNCLESASDWYAVGDLWIGAECWDPFGDFAHLDERRSRGGVDTAEDAMLGGRTENGLGGAGNTVTPRPDHCKGVAMPDSTRTVRPASPDRPKTEPVRLGDLLPDVLAEMRRLQREREAR